MIGFEGRDSLLSHMPTKTTKTENFLIRHFSANEQSLEMGELDNAHRLPGVENSADGLTRVRSDMVAL